MLEKIRASLQKELELICGANVYFQPPETLTLKYPCAIYQIADAPSVYADGIKYNQAIRFQITYVTKKAMDDAVEKMLRNPFFNFQRFFASAGLNHYVFSTER